MLLIAYDSQDVYLTRNPNNCPNCRGNWTSKKIYKNVHNKVIHTLLPKKHISIIKHMEPPRKYKYNNIKN